MKVLNFGSLNLDNVYKTDHFVSAGETLTADSVTVNAGGKGLNQSIALSRAGADVYHAGCLGKGGQMLKDTLESNGVNTSMLKEVDQLQGNAIIQVNKEGENCILLFGGSNRCITKQQINETMRRFDSGDYIILQNEVNCLNEIVDSASSFGLKIVLNPSPFDFALNSVDWSKLDWIILNEVEAQRLMEDFLYQDNINISENPKLFWEAAHDKWPDLKIVLTLGSHGAWAFTTREEIFQEAFKVKPVDTTAAGDTFTGYFFASLIKGKSIKECMRLAAKASSIAVCRQGAASSIPRAEEVS
ncbi:MAG: ribokinase [Sphaerochaetaceae bacterium]|nr:ribokinase [Sphaerochaetaceae bacterium]